VSERPDYRGSRPAVSANPSPGRSFRPLEIAVLVHVGVLLLLASWAFGGAADWARRLISAWGSLGLVITVAALRSRVVQRVDLRSPLLWLAPFAAFNALVLLSCLNPSFSAHLFAGQSLLAHTGAAHPGLPSTAHVGTSLEHLWLFDAIYLSCFNLALAIRRRRALRLLLLVAVGNTALLAVFGTFQKLTSDGLYFGLVPAPNPRFFATFVYANHWAAYSVMIVAACLGLLFRSARSIPGDAISRSPLTMGIIALILISMTPLLAGSRAGTLLVLVLLAAGLIHVLLHLRRARRQAGVSVALPLGGLVLGVVLTAGGAAYLARDAINERWQDTQGQWRAGLFDERVRLYSDTWQLAEEQPVFGWGLGSFDKILQLIRPRPLEANRQYEHSYVDAHSDWLQSLAEVGWVGTLLVGLCGLLPLLSLRRAQLTSPLPGYLLAGCGLVLLYAAVEFPFGNPAVVIVFWLCFFCAVQHCRLQSSHHGAARPGPPAVP
jgi:O-antigen ligase